MDSAILKHLKNFHDTIYSTIKPLFLQTDNDILIQFILSLFENQTILFNKDILKNEQYIAYEYTRFLPIRKNILDFLDLSNQIILHVDFCKDLNYYNQKIRDSNDEWYKTIYPDLIDTSNIHINAQNMLNIFKNECFIQEWTSVVETLNTLSNLNFYIHLCKELIPLLPNNVFLLLHPFYWPTMVYNILILNFIDGKTGLTYIDLLNDNEKNEKIEILTTLNDDNLFYKTLKDIRFKHIIIKSKTKIDSSGWEEDLKYQLKHNRQNIKYIRSPKYEEFLNRKTVNPLYFQSNIQDYVKDQNDNSIYVTPSLELIDKNYNEIVTNSWIIMRNLFFLPFYQQYNSTKIRKYFELDDELYRNKFFLHFKKMLTNMVLKISGTAPIISEYKLQDNDYHLFNIFIIHVREETLKLPGYETLKKLWSTKKTFNSKSTLKYEMIYLLQIFDDKNEVSGNLQDLNDKDKEEFKELMIDITVIVNTYNRIEEIRDICRKTNLEETYPLIPLLISGVHKEESTIKLEQTHQIESREKYIQLKHSKVLEFIDKSIENYAKDFVIGDLNIKASDIALINELFHLDKDRIKLHRLWFKNNYDNIFYEIFKTRNIEVPLREKYLYIDKVTKRKLDDAYNDQNHAVFETYITTYLVRPSGAPPTYNNVEDLVSYVIEENMRNDYSNHIFIEPHEYGNKLYCVDKDIIKSTHYPLLLFIIKRYGLTYKEFKTSNNPMYILISKISKDENSIDLQGEFSLLFIKNVFSLKSDIATSFYISKNSWIHHIYATKYKLRKCTIQFCSHGDIYNVDVDNFSGIFSIINSNAITPGLQYNIIHNIIIGLMSDSLNMDFFQLHEKMWQFANNIESSKIKPFAIIYNEIKALVFNDNNRDRIKAIKITRKVLNIQWIKIIQDYDDVKLYSLVITNNNLVHTYSATGLTLAVERTGLSDSLSFNVKFFPAVELAKNIIMSYKTNEIIKNPKFNYENLKLMDNSDNRVDVIDFKPEETINPWKSAIHRKKIPNKIILTVHPLKINSSKSSSDVPTKTLSADWYFMYKLQIPLLQYMCNYYIDKNEPKPSFQITGLFKNNVMFRTPFSSITSLYEKKKDNVNYNQHKMANIFIIPGGLKKPQYGNEIIDIDEDSVSGNINYYLINNASTYAEHLFDIQNAYKIFQYDDSKYNKNYMLSIMKRLDEFKNLGGITNTIPYNIIYGTKNTKHTKIIEKSVESTKIKEKTAQNRSTARDNVIFYNNIKITNITSKTEPDFTKVTSYGVNNVTLVKGYNQLLKSFVSYVNSIEFYNFDQTKKQFKYEYEKKYPPYNNALLKIKMKSNNHIIYSPTQYMKRLLLESHLLNNIDQVDILITKSDNTTETFTYQLNNQSDYELDIRKPNKGLDPFFNTYPFFDIETDLVHAFINDRVVKDLNIKPTLQERSALTTDTWLTSALNNFYNIATTTLVEKKDIDIYKKLYSYLNITNNDMDIQTIYDKDVLNKMINECIEIIDKLETSINEEKQSISKKIFDLEKHQQIEKKLKNKKELQQKLVEQKKKTIDNASIESYNSKLDECTITLRKLDAKRNNLLQYKTINITQSDMDI